MAFGDNYGRRNLIVEKKNERKPYKVKPWSHQDELKSLVGRPVRLYSAVPDFNRPVHEGVLVQTDAYTLKLERLVEGRKSVVTYFKSGLAGYEEIV
jgi:hypothetical protein